MPTRRAALLAATLAATPALRPRHARAQSAWTIGTEYPATSMPGEGIAHFAGLVNVYSGAAMIVTDAPDAPQGLRSAALPAAVAEGKLQAACAFTGALAGQAPLFGLSALPFLTASVSDAARLLAAARSQYSEALASRGLLLLYTTPWPPSGIWSRAPIAGPEQLAGLRIRTYDATSTAVFRAAGAAPEQISFADAGPKLRAGALDAVLSSGDGGAGARLWELLPHFTAIDYAWPLSLAFCSSSALHDLPTALQQDVVKAGADTETRQWQAIEGRLAQNESRMRAAGMTIAQASPPLSAVLREAARPVVERWATEAGPQGSAILEAFRRRT